MGRPSLVATASVHAERITSRLSFEPWLPAIVLCKVQIRIPRAMAPIVHDTPSTLTLNTK